MKNKVKSKDVKNMYGKKCGKKNNIPKEICPVLQRLDELDFVNRIVTSPFRPSKNGEGIKIIGYDEKARAYHISVSAGRYEQRMVLDVPNQDPVYEGLIKKCFYERA